MNSSNEDESAKQSGWTITLGPLSRVGSPTHQANLAKVREGLPETPAHQAVLQKAEQGSPEHLQALLAAKNGRPDHLNKLLAQHLPHLTPDQAQEDEEFATRKYQRPTQKSKLSRPDTTRSKG